MTTTAARLYLSVVLVAALHGCAAEAPPDPARAEPDWERIDTGHACAAATVACGAGNCATRIDNQCAEPLTCELEMMSLCRAYTGESGEATARAQKTIPAGQRGGAHARVVCNVGEVLNTRAQTLRCNSGPPPQHAGPSPRPIVPPLAGPPVAGPVVPLPEPASSSER